MSSKTSVRPLDSRNEQILVQTPQPFAHWGRRSDNVAGATQMTIGIYDPADHLSLTPGRFQETELSLELISSTTAIDSRDQAFDFVVVAGESALLDLVRETLAVPVLPVAVGAGVPSIPKQQIDSGLESLAGGAFELQDIPTIEVKLGQHTFRALMDVMAITAEPARISEYRTTTSPTGTVVDQVRADGITVSGPGGTPGYGTAAGGPVLGPDVRGVAVVPVGQFRTEQPHWVLNPPFEIEVVREEVPVSLVVDDRSVDAVPAHEPIRFDWGQPVECIVLEESESPVAKNSTVDTAPDPDST